MSQPIRVAQIIGMATNGGVESVIMNYYRHIDKSKVQFDFFVESESKIINKEEIEKLGGRVIIIPSYKNLFRYNKELKKIFEKNKYDIVHSNINTLSIFPLRVAKKCGIKIRIAHSHSTSHKKEWKRNLLKNILRKFSKVYSTHYFACSELAGRYQFGNKAYDKGEVVIVKNAIDVDKFLYNEKDREKIRKEINVVENFVIGHVGRFVNVKNHDFLVDVFNEVAKENDKAILLLIGDGPLHKEIYDKIVSLGLKDKVIFYGSTSEVAPLYNAMDVFAFPSLYEGLGITLIEAQINGLHCIASDNIPKEAKITKNVIFVPLDDKEFFKNNLIRSYNKKRDSVDLANEEILQMNINYQSDALTNIYLSLLKNNKK